MMCQQFAHVGVIKVSCIGIQVVRLGVLGWSVRIRALDTRREEDGILGAWLDACWCKGVKQDIRIKCYLTVC